MTPNVDVGVSATITYAMLEAGLTGSGGMTHDIGFRYYWCSYERCYAWSNMVCMRNQSNHMNTITYMSQVCMAQLDLKL